MPPTDYQGYVSIATLVAGVAAFWRWVAPRLDKVIDTVPAVKDLCERNTVSLEELSCATQAQAGNFEMLTRLMSASQAAGAQCRRLVLLVEDDFIAARLVRGLCADLVAKFKLMMIDVGRLEDALQHIPYARVMILDVTLPDCDLATIQSLVRVCSCPVVIHTGGDYTKEHFPTAFSVLRKGADGKTISETIEAAITDSRAMGGTC